MSNKERLDILNTSFERLSSHSNAISQCGQQTDALLCRLEQIKEKLMKKERNVGDDFKEIHESHIQNATYIQALQQYEEECVHFMNNLEEIICGKPLCEPIWHQQLDKECLNESILFELYRTGKFKVSEQFIKESKIKNEHNKEKQKFIELHRILTAMDAFEIEPALKWIAEKEKENEEKETDDAVSNCFDILRFLLHRDRFLHIAAKGTKDEMRAYMRSELETLRVTAYKNKTCTQLITNLHFEASQIAYYCEEWKFLYFVKTFSRIPLSQIPIVLGKESLQIKRIIIMKRMSF